MLRGHYNYYGIGGNKRAPIKLYDKVEKFWWKMLCSRCRKGYIKWDIYNEIKKKYPILRPRIRIPMAKYKVIVSDNRHGDYSIEAAILKPIDAEVIIENCMTEEEMIIACKDADGVLLDLAPMTVKVVKA